MPHAHFQGEYPVGGGGVNMYPAYLGKYNLYVDQESPAEIEMSVTENDSGEKVLKADVTMTGDITTTNNKIIFILTHYWSDSYSCTVSFYADQDFDLTTAGETGSFSNVINYDSSWDLEDIKAVVLIQSFSTDSKFIHQAAIDDIEMIFDPLAPEVVDFGEVEIGTSVTEQITITNYWGETMSGMIFPLPNFDIASTFSVDPYSEQVLDITFTPTEEILYDNFIIMMADTNPVFDTQLLPVRGIGVASNNSDENEILPEVSRVIGNYPNPFNPSAAGRGPTTYIEYNLIEGSSESLLIFNIKGQEVKRFTALDPGHNTISWDGRDNTGKELPSGIYFSKLGSEKKGFIKKMVLVK